MGQRVLAHFAFCWDGAELPIGPEAFEAAEQLPDGVADGGGRAGSHWPATYLRSSSNRTINHKRLSLGGELFTFRESKAGEEDPALKLLASCWQ